MRQIPPTRYPFSIEKTYENELLKLIKMVESITLKHYKLIIQPTIERYRSDVDELSLIQKIIEVIKGLSLGIFNDTSVVDIANRFVKNLDLFNMKNINDQATAAGVNLLANDKVIDDFVKTAIVQNVSYIKSIESNLLDKVSTIIYEETKRGTSSKMIQEQLVKQFDVSRDKAKFLAVDQSGSMFGQLTKQRHTSIGVNSFKWSTVGDGRVRPEHINYNGKTYSYTGGANGKFPGSSDYRCRCVGQPVFD